MSKLNTPYRQHTFEDGTVSAPAWSPVDEDHTDTRPFDRSWEASVKQLNPAGDPTHPRKQRQNFETPSEPKLTVSFENGKKFVHRGEPQTPQISRPTPTPRSAPFTTRRKVVGSRNPNASLKPAGTFSPSEE